MPNIYTNLNVRTYKEVRDAPELTKSRSRRVNIDLTEDEWLVIRRHADSARCSMAELLGAIVRKWMSEHPTSK